MLSHGGFDLHYSNMNDVDGSSCAYSPLISSFREMSIQIICPFLIGLFVLLMLSYKSYLCILDMNYLLLYVYNSKCFSSFSGLSFYFLCSVSLPFLLLLILFVSM